VGLGRLITAEGYGHIAHLTLWHLAFWGLGSGGGGAHGADSHNLMVVLAHQQGVAATFRVGRHHHRGPLCEGRGLTHALTHTAPTDLTVAAALVRKACSKRRRSRLWSNR